MDDGSGGGIGLLGLVIIGTSIWVLIDAQKIMEGLTESERDSVSKHFGTGPGSWFVLCLFLWIMAFPIYLTRRSRYVVIQKQRREAGSSERRDQVPSVGTSIAFEKISASRYRITGVDRATKMDTTWHCIADNKANAMVKAELEGIIVTEIVSDDS